MAIIEGAHRVDGMAMPAEVEVWRSDAVRIVVLHRPEELNAVNPAMHTALAVVWRLLAEDPDARSVVLTGSGRAFSAGGDFAMMTRLQQDEAFRSQSIAEARSMITEMIRFPLPVIAAVNGPAVGLGCSLVVLSDIVLISDAAHLADPHVSVGLVAGDGGAVAWPALTSLLRAKEYLFTGDRITPPVAVELGLANRVVPAAQLMDEAMTLARRLAAQPRQALQDTKRALNTHLEQAAVSAMDVALLAERESMTSRDHIDRVAALRDRGR